MPPPGPPARSPARPAGRSVGPSVGRLLLPAAPALVAGHGRGTLLTPDGELLALPAAGIAAALRTLPPPLLVHAPATARRLDLPRFDAAFDLLDLFAFCMPARGAAPTPRGLAMALDLDAPRDDAAAAALLPKMTTALLRHLSERRGLALNRDAAALAAHLGETAAWPWAPAILAALGVDNARASRDPLKVWRHLPDWEDPGPGTPPASFPVLPNEARTRLAEMLGGDSEQRPQQADYASAASAAFVPREEQGAARVVLAEAGTGTGKTLGYIAPASLWAERNGAPVWIATYTRNLQRQIDQELMRLYPDPEERRRRVVVRKGRENYLCLLNLEEMLGQAGNPELAVPLGLVSRWARATRDGDLLGGDFPGWITELHGPAAIWPLADRRSECIRSACQRYKQCYVEHSIRRARTATLVVANHALVMVQAAMAMGAGGTPGAGAGEDQRPLRYVFDEGHHLFDAADAAFSAALTGAETAELRRWLLGAEGGRSRARGLRRRIEDLAGDVAGGTGPGPAEASQPAPGGAAPDLLTPLEAALSAARALPGLGWVSRLGDDRTPATPDAADRPRNPTEALLHLVRRQVLARAPDEDSLYGSECDLHPLADGLAEAAETLERALKRLEEPLRTLRDRLQARLEDAAAELETGDRIRLETAAKGIERRALMPLGAWQAMLRALREPPPSPGERRDFVDWLALSRREGREVDAGLHRHWLDPTVPFALNVVAPAHGLLITSATLLDKAGLDKAGLDNAGPETASPDPEVAWATAEARTGTAHLPTPAIRAGFTSPFDYAAQSRAFVVTDVDKARTPQVAAAMGALFQAAGGGALGLFTAIRRLRESFRHMAPALEAAGIPLYAQHVDAMDNATLVDVFRAEEDACLLGTDAMRDGVDVPGRSLRLLVFDRVPWPRPSILHRERRIHLSGGDPKAYDDALSRHRLRQAFGRLIRRADDRGVFVLLDRSCPTRLLAGLPDGVPVRRVGLAEAVRETRAFLTRPPLAGSP